MPKGKDCYVRLSSLPEWKHKVIEAIESLCNREEFFTTEDVLQLSIEKGATIPNGAPSIASVMQFMTANDYFYFSITKRRVAVPSQPKKTTTLWKSHLYRRSNEKVG